MESDSGPAPSKVSAGSLVAVFLLTAITGTLLAYGILFLAAQARHCGEWSGMLLPGYQFGVPDHLYEKGVVPNCEVGWDGQFYYLQSNYLNPDPEPTGTSTRLRIATNASACHWWRGVLPR